MIVLYIVAFALGLLLAVYAMLNGVERGGATIPGLAGSQPVKTRISLPIVAAAATAFGVVGAALYRWSTVSTGMQFVAALATAGLVVATGAPLFKAWVRSAQGAPPEDPRFALMGHLAQVTTRIATTSDGEIAYQVDGARYASKARSLDGSELDAGADVVIERVEDGIAYVEAWSQVEQRL